MAPNISQALPHGKVPRSVPMTNMPPPPPRSQSLNQNAQNNAPQQDNFLSMSVDASSASGQLTATWLTTLHRMQGPAVKVVVGQGLAATSYTLPIALLSAHSLAFQGDIARLMSADGGMTSANKKRKLEPATLDDETAKDAARTAEGIEQADEMVIQYPDVDPVIFGLFLQFIFQGSYPVTVDVHPPVKHVPRKNPTMRPDTLHGHAETQVRQPPVIPHHPHLPPSFRAWLLGGRLCAPTFMNQATDNIYHGIGPRFPLTPGIVQFVWQTTRPTPSCALRRLVLGFLVQFWHAGYEHVLARIGYDGAWAQVFDAFPDIRMHLLFTKGERALEVQGYYVHLSPPAVRAGDGNSAQGGNQRVKKPVRAGSAGQGGDTGVTGHDVALAQVATVGPNIASDKTVSKGTTPAAQSPGATTPTTSSADSATPATKTKSISPTPAAPSISEETNKSKDITTIKKEDSEAMDVDAQEKDTGETMDVDPAETEKAQDKKAAKNVDEQGAAAATEEGVNKVDE
ncbi:hypothetical protein NX059_006478 [Plenodomus lindquistii]|nr:hypothetical protein NX059_006478 [Plenodomus lindquistii]